MDSSIWKSFRPSSVKGPLGWVYTLSTSLGEATVLELRGRPSYFQWDVRIPRIFGDSKVNWISVDEGEEASKEEAMRQAEESLGLIDG